MRRRHTEEQILGILHEADAGRKVDELCRAHGIAKHTYYRWKAKYGGLQVNDAKRLRALEDENRKLKSIVADLTLDNQTLKGLLSRKWRGLWPQSAPRVCAGRRLSRDRAISVAAISR